MSPPHTADVALDHVAIAVPRGEAAAAFLVGELGGRPVGAGPGAGFRFWQWEFKGGARIEVIEPDGPPGGFLHRFLESRGSGIHHVTFKVPVIEEAAQRAEALGYEIVGFDDSWPGWKEAFLHPKQAQGIVVQLAESNPELEPDDFQAPTFPQTPAPAGEAAELVGVRLLAASRERARRQWGDALLGQCSERNGELEFCWPGSPLRIVVGVAPGAPEGPVGIEVAAQPNLTLPAGDHPELGTAFLPVHDAAPR